jgi:hypothetical protein
MKRSTRLFFIRGLFLTCFPVRLTGPHTRPSSRYSHRSAFWVSMYKAIPNALPILLPVNQPVNPPSPFEDEDDDLKIDMCVHKRI